MSTTVTAKDRRFHRRSEPLRVARPPIVMVTGGSFAGWLNVENMLTHFPKAVPEIPVGNVDTAAEYYVNALGFQFDWGNYQDGIGGISQGECRMFLTNAPFRRPHGTGGPAVVWLNLDSRHEVDELYLRWREAGAKILSEPEDKPWRLREFTVADLDGNQLRVFYDFSWESCKEQVHDSRS